MTMPAPSIIDLTSGIPQVEYGRSADGFLVARVGDTAFAVVSAQDNRLYLATGWRIRRPIEEWTRSDFYGHAGELADEAAFRAEVVENAEHQREKRALGRREIRSTADTPRTVGRMPVKAFSAARSPQANPMRKIAGPSSRSTLATGS